MRSSLGEQVTIGQRFIRPELQLLFAFYGIHFAVWVPMALRFSPPAILVQLLMVIAPLAACFGISAIWHGVSFIIRKNKQLSQTGPSFLLIFHVCLLATTILCAVMQVVSVEL